MSSDEYGTPPRLYKIHDARFGGFKCDLAATKHNAKCADYFTKETSALERDWPNNGWNFLNPPYSELPEWMRKAWEQWCARGAQTFCLIPVRTDQPFFHEILLANQGKYMHFEYYLSRIHFINSKTGLPDTQPRLQSMNVIIGDVTADRIPIYPSLDARRYR